MSGRVWALAALCAALGACVTPAPQEDAPPSEPPAPVAQKPAAAPATPLDVLEERHRARALAYARESNWADALVQWELLALLKPNSQDYRNAVAETRARIANITAGLTRAAELARKQDNFDQATLLYLRVLYIDRDNAAAAQALREIDAERTRRAYANRPPRMRM